MNENDISKYILNFLSNVDSNNLNHMINNDVDLSNALLRDPIKLGFIRAMLGDAEKNKINSIDVEDILSYLKEHRIDLYKTIINNKNGIRWLAYNLKKFKYVLLY